MKKMASHYVHYTTVQSTTGSGSFASSRGSHFSSQRRGSTPHNRSFATSTGIPKTKVPKNTAATVRRNGTVAAACECISSDNALVYMDQPRPRRDTQLGSWSAQSAGHQERPSANAQPAHPIASAGHARPSHTSYRSLSLCRLQRGTPQLERSLGS